MYTATTPHKKWSIWNEFLRFWVQPLLYTGRPSHTQILGLPTRLGRVFDRRSSGPHGLERSCDWVDHRQGILWGGNVKNGKNKHWTNMVASTSKLQKKFIFREQTHEAWVVSGWGPEPFFIWLCIHRGVDTWRGKGEFKHQKVTLFSKDEISPLNEAYELRCMKMYTSLIWSNHHTNLAALVKPEEEHNGSCSHDSHQALPCPHLFWMQGRSYWGAPGWGWQQQTPRCWAFPCCWGHPGPAAPPVPASGVWTEAHSGGRTVAGSFHRYPASPSRTPRTTKTMEVHPGEGSDQDFKQTSK